MRKLAAVLVIITSLLISPRIDSVFAGQIEDGIAAYQRGDYKTALPLLKPTAEKGDVHAQGLIGIMYNTGQGVPKDYIEGTKWTRMAAEGGLAEAQSDLGNIYLGGKGVPKDYVEATKWFKRAAAQGNPRAQLDLGTSYFFGLGVPKDNVFALMWMNLAASRFPEEETDLKKSARNFATLLTAGMSSTQITEAERMAREWKPKKER